MVKSAHAPNPLNQLRTRARGGRRKPASYTPPGNSAANQQAPLAVCLGTRHKHFPGRQGGPERSCVEYPGQGATLS